VTTTSCGDGQLCGDRGALRGQLLQLLLDAAAGLSGVICQRGGGLPAVTPVPDRWLHLTMQGVGFTDEVTDADLRAITDSAGTRLTAIEPVTVQLGPAVVGDEAVALPAQPGR
jgi:hypothetical protein